MAHRQEKLNRLIRDEIGMILQQELDFEEGVWTTVTRTEVSEDLRHAKVFISVFPSSAAGAVLKEIQKEIYHFQQILNKKLRIYPVPKIYFVLDTTEEKAAKVEKLIEESKK